MPGAHPTSTSSEPPQRSRPVSPLRAASPRPVSPLRVASPRPVSSLRVASLRPVPLRGAASHRPISPELTPETRPASPPRTVWPSRPSPSSAIAARPVPSARPSRARHGPPRGETSVPSRVTTLRSVPSAGHSPARLASPPHVIPAQPDRARPALRVITGGASNIGRAGPMRGLAGALRADRGQAAVEFVAVLPIVLVIIALCGQALVAGMAVWDVRVAARAAARANAFGGDAAAAARSELPSKLERGLQVHAERGGDVRVSLRVPAVLPAMRLGRVAATSHFRPQG